MAISMMIARAILGEHRFRPISGNAILIGRHTLPYTVEQAVVAIRQENVPVRDDVLAALLSESTPEHAIDDSTRHGKGKGYIKDKTFFSLFSDATVTSLDVTDYEGADIVHDLHTPVPEELHGRFDFMFNGSCLDNMADPIAAMHNTVKMLKPGGRVVLTEIGTPHHNGYLIFSPAWFFDYFAINQFDDCKVYVCLFDPTSWAIHHGPFDVFTWTAFEATMSQFPYAFLPPQKAALVLTIAEKGPESTWHRTPLQGQYRPDHTPYKLAFERFARNPRPLIQRPASQRTYDQMYGAIHQQNVMFLGSLEE